MPKHQKWGGFVANNDVLQNRMDTCAFRMHALSPTKEQPDFSPGLLTEHRRLPDLFLFFIFFQSVEIDSSIQTPNPCRSQVQMFRFLVNALDFDQCSDLRLSAYRFIRLVCVSTSWGEARLSGTDQTDVEEQEWSMHMDSSRLRRHV